MAAVTDTETAHGTDGGEHAALPSVVVTGLNIIDGAGGPAQGLVMFDSSPQVEVAPGSGGASGVIEFPVVTQVYNGAMLPVILPDTSLAFASPFTYIITLKLEGYADLQFSGVTLTRSQYPNGADLSQLV